MSFMNKMLSSIGIGSATVDTKLHKLQYAQGERVTGVIVITGGKVAQKIDQIYLALNTQYVKESDDKKYNVTTTIDSFKVSDSFTIEAGERGEIPFSFVLPKDTPITAGSSKVWLQTGLDIKNAIDPGDKDAFTVEPSPEVAAVLNAVKQLGFTPRQIGNKQATSRLRGQYPFIQEFEFVPTSGAYRGLLDELEVVFFIRGNEQFEVMMQIDKKARGLGGLFREALDMDETYVRFNVSPHDIHHVGNTIQHLINQHSHR